MTRTKKLAFAVLYGKLLYEELVIFKNVDPGDFHAISILLCFVVESSITIWDNHL